MDHGQVTSLPFWTRLTRGFRIRFRSRPLADFEWTLLHSDENREIEVYLFAERRPLVFELAFLTDERLEIESVHYGTGDDLASEPFVVTKSHEGGIVTLAVDPVHVTPTRRIVFRLTKPPGKFRGRVDVKVVSDDPRDLRLVLGAHALAERESFDEAVEMLREYEEYATDNPAVCAWLAEWSGRRGRLDDAEEYVVRAFARGNPEACFELYRTLQTDREPRPVAEIRQLHEEASEWSLGPLHGVVVLDRFQSFSLGKSAGQLRKCRETFEIRRPAAARMLRQIPFPFSGTRELVLQTKLRVIRPNGNVEDAPEERFTIGDHESRNIFITVEDEKAGHWILPDLAPGDIVECTYDLLHREKSDGKAPQVFVLSALFHEYFPTFRATSKYVVPGGVPVEFAVRNTELEHRHWTAEGRDVYVFEGSRFVPSRLTGFAFENQHLNPVIACSSTDIDWPGVVRRALRTNFGATAPEEEPPTALRELIRGESSRAAALEKAFYWVRDKLRYASTRSTQLQVGAADRARKIVEAGLGDCKDKSYLLALACRELETPYEFVAVSAKNGLVIEDLPADQFDHVFLRARVDDRWIYLDAANPLATFGSPPAWCQGMRALVLNDEARIVTIPTDPPEVNAFEITEVLNELRDGRLGGRFELRARGQNARLADERWKAISLSFDDPLHAGQDALRQYLPASLVVDYARRADTSESSAFRVEGHHSRGPLVALPRDRRVIGTLSWELPFLPIGYWRTLQIDRLFVIDLPVKVCLTVRLEGELRRAVEDVSRLEPLANAIARVGDEVLEEPDATTIRRDIVLEKKIFRGDEIDLIPPTFERIEEALQLVLACDPARVKSWAAELPRSSGAIAADHP